ncbi:cation channel protein, putative [Bodo saltans]|uniref:Cation channel protein, putative n=1 Tax=Bodo saltans TaxID=75058 RepID=A0A0S4IY90_BODSA|nr:cation channel protein, putative [Bodo saltans]|eukprot:CUG06117.1 cation channel protein, putative [Bodo saltans]
MSDPLPPRIELTVDAGGAGDTTPRRPRSISDNHLMTPRDAKQLQVLHAKRKTSMDMNDIGATPPGQLFSPPLGPQGHSPGTSSLGRRATILHKHAALWNSRHRNHGMFSGNAAHDLSNRSAAAQVTLPKALQAAHAGGARTSPAASEGAWALRRRSSAPFAGGFRGGSLLTTPAEGGLHQLASHGCNPSISVGPLALPPPAAITHAQHTGADFRSAFTQDAEYDAKHSPGPRSSKSVSKLDDGDEAQYPDIPMMITVADFGALEARSATLGDRGFNAAKRKGSQSTPSTGVVNPLSVPSLITRKEKPRQDPLAQSASFNENGEPILIEVGGDGTSYARRRNSIPRASLGDNERLLSARRNRSFGGFDDRSGLNRDHSSGDDASAGVVTPRVSSMAPSGDRQSPQLNPILSVGMLGLEGTARSKPLVPHLSMGGLRQPIRSFRRQSYASPEAMQPTASIAALGEMRGGGPRAPRRRSMAKKPEFTPFEEFQKALDSAVDKSAPITDSAMRRHSSRASNNDLQFDFTGAFGPQLSHINSSIDLDGTQELPPKPGARGASPRRRRSGDNSESDDDGASSNTSGSRRGSFSRMSRTEERRLHNDFLITPSSTKDDHAALNVLDSEHGGSNPEDKKRRLREGLSEVEMHLYRSSLNPIPLQFVVEEVRQKVERDRMYTDLVYFIPFLLVFTFYFVGRDITENFYTTAKIRAVNTQQPTFARQVDVLNEFYRLDTQEYDGSQAVYQQGDGTDVNNQEFGPQILRMSKNAKIPYIYNVEDIMSKADILHWLSQVFVPSLWDCQNPDFHNNGVTNIGGNTVLVGAARIRSIRMKEGCADPNPELWRKTLVGNETWDLSCYDELDASNVDDSPYCNEENPAFSSTSSYDPRLQQTTQAHGSVAATETATSAFSSVQIDDIVYNETMYQFLQCEMSSTTGVSEQSVVNLRHPCSGHYVTLPFQASCNEVQATLDIMRPSLMDRVYPQEAESDVLYNLFGRYNSKVPTNSCSAFVFHESVRLVVVEYFSYSVSSDAFFRSRMILEMVKGGAIVPNHSIRAFRVWTTSSIFEVLLQGVVLIFVVNFVFRMLSDWSTSRRLSGSYFTYIKDPWNLIDVVNNVTLVASAILTALWWSASLGITISFNRQPRYPTELQNAEELYTTQVYCNAVNIILIYMKVLKFLRINDRLGIMTKTLGECQQDILSLMALFLFIHTGFSIMGTAVFGMSMNEFRSVGDSFVTLLLALLTGIDYDTMRSLQPTLTPLFFWLFIMTEVYLLLNFFIAILGEGFAQVNQSMHLPSLDLALLRFVDEFRMVFRWNYIRETLMNLTAKRKRSHIKALVEMHSCLEEHLRLSLLAVEDLRSHTSREHVPMHFRDMEWWLPKDIYNTLGRQYLLILWEDMLYAYNIKERLNSKSGERAELARAVQEGVREVAESFPDILSLEVQAEVIFDKLEKLPLKIVEWSIAQQQHATRLDQMNDNERRSARKAELLRRKSSQALFAQREATQNRQQRELDDALDDVAKPMFGK